MALRFTNGVDERVTYAAAASINNMSVGSALMWINLSTIAPAAQRNFWGKSTGGNRNVAYITATIVGVEIGGTAVSRALVTSASALPNFGSGKWCLLAFTWNVGTDQPRTYCGDLSNLVLEATSYTLAGSGTFGAHDDSAVAWTVGNSSGGGTGNTIPGDIALFMVWNRVLTLAELQDQQFNPRITSGCVVYTRFGFNGVSTQPDWSGNGNSGTVTGSSAVADVPLRQPFGFDRGWLGNPSPAGGGPLIHGGQLLRSPLLRGGRLVA